MKSIVITGVSSGIGLECSKIFARNGYKVFGSVRTESDAANVKKEIGDNFTALILDVTDKESIKKGAELVDEETGKKGIAGLINNAGVAISGPLTHITLQEMHDQFDVNVFGLLSVTQAFLPLLGTRENYKNQPGKIINISSVSGKIAYPFAGPYAASKHAVEALSHSLRRELLLYGIDVIVIGPGSVNTPIWQKEPLKNIAQIYKNTEYGKILNKLNKEIGDSKKHNIQADFVAQRIFKIFHKRYPKARYAIYSKKLQSWVIEHVLTNRMLDYFIHKKLFGK